MSYNALLVHRVTVKRLTETEVDGASTYDWHNVEVNERCRVDLNFQRHGKDPMQWTPEAGRATDKTGVAFFLPTANIRPGDRIVVTLGPTGTFLVEGAFEEILGRHGRVHHYEVGIKEVAPAIAKASS